MEINLHGLSYTEANYLKHVKHLLNNEYILDSILGNKTLTDLTVLSKQLFS